MKRFFIFSQALMLSLALSAQTQVTDYHPGVTEDGVTYFLPKTVVRVAVTAEKVHHEPGEYCEFAQRFLRLNDVTQAAYDEWTIKSVTLSTYGVADKTNAYSIKFKQKTSAPFVGLSPDGRLLAINAEAPEAPQLPQASVVAGNKKSTDGASFKTQEILSAGSTAKMAELTANEIYDIRENRGLLAKGQADFMPKDGEQLRLMLASLDAQEEGLLSLFKGTESVETHTFVMDVTPNADSATCELFRFSKYLGMVAADDPIGMPVYVTVKDLKTVPEQTPNPKGKQKKEVEDVRYVVPSRVEVCVYDDCDTYAKQSFPMAQFGRVEHLGGELFNKKSSTRIVFFPETGGIAKIEGEVQ